jgi:membrane protein implicated in regulation of membrane protease activity
MRAFEAAGLADTFAYGSALLAAAGMAVIGLAIGIHGVISYSPGRESAHFALAVTLLAACSMVAVVLIDAYRRRRMRRVGRKASPSET